MENSIAYNVVKKELEERDKSFDILMKQFGVLIVCLALTLCFAVKMSPSI